MLNTFRECRDSAAMLQSRIREHGEEGERQFYCEMRDLLASGTIDRNRVNLRNLFETFVDDGRMMLDRMRPGYRGDDSLLFEASDATSTRAFQNIVGQITYSSVMDAMENEDFIGDQLMTTVPADTQYQEIIPGIGAIGDVAGEVSEGDPYPIVGLGEDYVIAPEKVKDGFILPITDEVIFEDKTGQLMTRANSAAEALGITREKEQLDTALGITNSYRRLGGAAQATYGATHTEGTFDNLAASNALADFTDIEAALLLFNAMTDPNSGEPVKINGTLQVVVPDDLEMTALNILNAIEVKHGADSGAVQTITTNTLSLQSRRRFELVTSNYVALRTSSESTWFIGDFRGAFQYREIWPVQVFRQGRESDAAFTSDIAFAIKVRRKGSPAVLEPRKVIKCTA